VWSSPASRIALVTGAGSGIGRHVALALAEAGYAVILSGRTLERLDETAAQAKRGSTCVPFVVDVTDPASVADLFIAIEQKFGRLDLLFNNAGVNVASQPLEDVRYSDWRKVLDTNLTGAFLCTQGAFRLMKRQRPRGGRIINNGSVSAMSPRPGSAAYTAAKHGMTGLTKSTSLDGRAFDIACGQIDIGNAGTDMADHIASGTEQADGSIAIEPVIDVKLVARAVVQMADLSLDANVQFMSLIATKMPLIGRG
jgi:NAD(P)-dependent dehydrogenase (short-subunit alcohol dehydrogenase family)